MVVVFDVDTVSFAAHVIAVNIAELFDKPKEQAMASAVESLIRGAVTKGVTTVADFNRNRMKADRPNPYLTGIHAPMTEELTLTDLVVSGTIPPELDGRYIRIGPNPVTPQNHAAYHWFTGDGMVHGVRLQGGKALWYRNRWTKSSRVTDALGLPMAPGKRNGPRDTVNTNVLGHAGETWAVVEAGGYPVRINEELETIAFDPFGDTLKGSFSAHPHRDVESGEMHAICYEGTDTNTIRHVVVDANGKVRREEPIRVSDGPSIHDCMITKNFVIILDLPVTFSMKTLLAGHPFPYAWNPAHKARVGLLPREGTNADVIWCDVAPCYVFHPCNAFEDADGNVIMDVCAHSTMFAESKIGPDSAHVPFERWTINPATRTTDRKIIDADSQEFPRPNEAHIGKPYRYAYTMALPDGFDAGSPNQSKLFKHDLDAGTKQVHDFGAGRVPGEFVFVPKADSNAEDEGWLMGYVVNMDSETTDLVILDAANFDGPAQAVITMPHRIPPGFHGNWVAG
jgi:8'-apo-carotenoid 13,14-cleaving dioxygenase